MGMTLAELTKAIQQHIDLDMDAEVAQGMAERTLGFFGFYNRIIDNALEPTDRNLFYMFQDYDLLTTESEETTLWDGREWRIHCWKFKPDLRERVEAYMQRNLQEGQSIPSLTSTPRTGQAFGPERAKKWPTPMHSPPIDERSMQAFLIRIGEEIHMRVAVGLVLCMLMACIPPPPLNSTPSTSTLGPATLSTATST